jgi:hypothetical protein
MDTVKPNPFLAEVEKLLTTLGLDFGKAKHTVPNGELLFFNFNDIPMYVCAPSVLPNNYSNLIRIDAEVAELREVDAGHLIVSIASYLYVHDCTPVRVTSKKSEGQKIKVLLEFVCDLQSLQVGSLAPILLHCCELADQLRSELVIEGQREVA